MGQAGLCREKLPPKDPGPPVLRKLEQNWHNPAEWWAQYIVGHWKVFGRGPTPHAADADGIAKATALRERMKKGDYGLWVRPS